MVECIRPEPRKTIADPACGTGGFFLAAYDYIVGPELHGLDKEEKEFLKHKTFYGNEIVAGARRLALMNMFLHNIGEIDSETFISSTDSLVADSGLRVDYVLTNPPFGKKSSMTFTNEEGEQEKEDLTYNRQDFWATTSNKQLNFVQHIRTMLKTDGQGRRGRSGQCALRRRRRGNGPEETSRNDGPPHDPAPADGHLLRPGREGERAFLRRQTRRQETVDEGNLVLRLPHEHPSHPEEEPLKLEDLRDFIDCYQPENRHNREGNLARRKRTRKAGGGSSPTTRSWPATRPASTSSGCKDKSLADLDNLPDPDVLANDIIENLESAVESFKEIMASINGK